jgi:hypothetical protein
VTIRNHTISGLDVAIETNAYGFRGPELGAPEPGRTRVLVLGDSITWGDYLPVEEVYVARAEAHLADASGRAGERRHRRRRAA